MLKKINCVVATMLLFGYAAAQTNAIAIQKRWVAVDVAGNEQKKEKYADRFAREQAEMEFKKGTLYMYNKGVLSGTVIYTMAPDGKSILLKEGQRQFSMKIISLKGNVLQAVTSVASSDTIIYKVAGTFSKTTIAKKNNDILTKKWVDMDAQYVRRQDLVSNLYQLLKGYNGIDTILLDNMLAAKKVASKNNIDPLTLSVSSVRVYQQNQANLTQAISKVLVETEKHPALRSNESVITFIRMLEGLENRIAVAKMEYNSAANIHNKSLVLKPDPDADVAPAVKF